MYYTLMPNDGKLFIWVGVFLKLTDNFS